MNFAAFVMAGGTGKRFWPASRRDDPKQLLSIGDHPVMIRQTLNRLNTFLDPTRIFVVTASQHAESLRREIGSLPDENVIVEPEGRDTAACAGLSGLVARRTFDEDTVVGLFPADHRIPDDESFEEAVRRAVTGCEETNDIVCFGIEPDRPATGYGYIIPDPDSRREDGIMDVVEFTEKPDRNRASTLIEERGALWNGGMFFWSASTILEEINRYLPELGEGLTTIDRQWDSSGSLKETLEEHYADLPATSIDYGVIERTDRIRTLPVSFEWNDLGTWESVESLLERDERGNARSGDVVALDAEDSILVNRDGPTVAALGVDETIVVSTEDALLVCPKHRSEDVRELVSYLEEEGRTELL